MGLNGGFDDWQIAQVLALFGLFASLTLLFRIWRTPSGERRSSKSAFLIIPLVIFTVGNVVWYAVDSKPFWDARARLNESYELLDQVLGVEIVEQNGYGPITVLDSRRPETWPPNCIPGRLYGLGGATFAEMPTEQLLEQLAQHFEDEGFTVRRRSRNSVRGISAILEGRSFSYSVNLGSQTMSTVVDQQCLTDLGSDPLDCPGCVESFIES